MPSNTVTTCVASALTGDMFSAALSTSARDMSASMYGPRINSTRMAPNRVVNWNDLKSTVDSHLGKCNDCKGSGLYLAEKSTCSFATTLEVVCNLCNEDKEVNRLEISYLKKKINNLKATTKKERDNLRALQLKRNCKIRARKNKTLPRRERRMIRPVRNKKLSVRKRAKIWGKGSIVDYEINLRAMMAAFYCGTGGQDIAKALSFLGIPGGKSWEQAFTRHSPKMCDIISSVVNGVIRQSLEEEIKITIREILVTNKYTNEQIHTATTAFFAKDEQNIPALIRKVPLIVSYDMGWQKRSTGKLYDSLSGHGFIFGCKTGNIIGFRVKSKACSTCSQANSLNLPPEDHQCNINWDGASGAMEAGVVLQLCIDIHDNSGYPIYIEKICSDDDSTIRAHLQHTVNGKGKLPDHIPTPIFLADPSHRIKVMASPIFKLAQR